MVRGGPAGGQGRAAGPAVRGRGTGCRSWFPKGRENNSEIKPRKAPTGFLTVGPGARRGPGGAVGSARAAEEREGQM